MASILSNQQRAPVEIDGVHISAIVEPSTADEVASLLAEASASGRKVAPVGGETKLAQGNVPERVDLAVSTLGLSRVISYEPADLTLSVEAGARFADVQSLLAGQGQALPIETPDADRATIGGLIATASSGPRRFGSGTLRDLLIGISVAYPSGIVGKAGGLVVKNVTGFDMMRLHLGALGTLGIVVSANFKVLPAARDESTLLTEPATFSDSLRAADSVRWDRARPVAIDVVKSVAGWQTAIRFEGRPATVSRSIEDVRSTLGGTVLPAVESRFWWQRRIGEESLLAPEGTVLIRCGVKPTSTGSLLHGVEAALARHDISPEFMAVSPGMGSLIVRFRLPESVGLAPLQADLLAAAETTTILTAPVSAKRDIDVWGRVPETVSVMRALKSEFDPDRVLNPGRFVDRI